MNSPTKDQREAAALFYCRSLTGEQHDWVKHDNLIAENYDIDDDIVNLAQLLADREAAAVEALQTAAVVAGAGHAADIDYMETAIKMLREELQLARGAVCFWVENSGLPDFYLKDLKRLDAVLESTKETP